MTPHFSFCYYNITHINVIALYTLVEQCFLCSIYYVVKQKNVYKNGGPKSPIFYWFRLMLPSYFYNHFLNIAEATAPTAAIKPPPAAMLAPVVGNIGTGLGTFVILHFIISPSVFISNGNNVSSN